jgi:hypothetical protein
MARATGREFSDFLAGFKWIFGAGGCNKLPPASFNFTFNFPAFYFS